MSSTVVRTEQCPECAAKGEDNSEDNLAVYTDDHVHCFACGYHVDAASDKSPFHDMEDEILVYVSDEHRGIRVDTFKEMGVLYSKTKDALACILPGYDKTQYRKLDTKNIWFGGNDRHAHGLYFRDKFNEGGKAVTITEGWLDALSAYQMFGNQYTFVSITSSVDARKDCSADYEWLNTFDRIVLCFDADKEGQAAAAKVASLFDFNKVYVVTLPNGCKDANDCLTKDHEDDFRKAWYNAKRFTPDNIVSAYSEIDTILADEMSKPIGTYPFSELQQMTYGMRPGELTLFKAQTGVGKTEVMRAIEYHLIKETDENIGIVHLEEPKSRCVKGLLGYEYGIPMHLSDCPIPLEDMQAKYREMTRRDNRVHFYSHFGSEDPDVIIGAIRFMAGPCDCKIIFLDHISMVVSGLAQDDERKALDKLATQLAMLAQDLKVCIVFVSHVNDFGQTRGSRAISHVAHTIIELDRDDENEDDTIANTTTFRILKNRPTSLVGKAGAVFFNKETFLLSEVEDAPIKVPANVQA